MLWICCGLYSKSTTNRISGVWISTSCGLVVANHSELLYHVTTTSLYVIAKMDVVDETVNNKQFMQLSIASLIDAYHNEPTLWDRNVNAMEEEELA